MSPAADLPQSAPVTLDAGRFRPPALPPPVMRASGCRFPATSVSSASPAPCGRVEGGSVRRRIGVLILGVACFALGSVVQRLYDVRSGSLGRLATGGGAPAEPGAGMKVAVDFTNE